MLPSAGLLEKHGQDRHSLGRAFTIRSHIAKLYIYRLLLSSCRGTAICWKFAPARRSLLSTAHRRSKATRKDAGVQVLWAPPATHTTTLWPKPSSLDHPRTRPWRSPDGVEYATLEWVDRFTSRRLLEPIGHMPPAQFEAEYYRQQSGLAIPT